MPQVLDDGELPLHSLLRECLLIVEESSHAVIRGEVGRPLGNVEPFAVNNDLAPII
jgi:hypothetical protein